jgi:secreted trypsin-like serine protease
VTGFIVAGFGSVGDLGDGTFGRLLAADLMAVRRQSDLQLRLVDPVTRGESPGRSACSGDSGGPVFEETRTGLVLVGVVSWGANVSGSPGCGGLTGATPIAQVRLWITETAKRLGSPL